MCAGQPDWKSSAKRDATGARRQVDPGWLRFAPEDEIAFQDNFPILMASEVRCMIPPLQDDDNGLHASSKSPMGRLSMSLMINRACIPAQARQPCSWASHMILCCVTTGQCP